MVGLPAYAQVTGSGTVLPAVSSPPIISAPGASPAYTAYVAIASAIETDAEFADWVSENAAVQISVDPVLPRPEGESVFVQYRFFVTDVDGSDDITDAQVRLLHPDGSVHTEFAAAKLLGASSAITKEYFAEFEMEPTDMPATGINFYKIVVKAADAAIEASGQPYVDNTLAPKMFQYGSLLLLRATVNTFDFGAMEVGSKSLGVPVTLTNLGNVPVDNTLHATDLLKGSDLIPADQIWYGPTTAAAGTEFPPAAGNAKRDAGFNLAPGLSRVVYLAVDVPANVPAGVYTTTLTFTGVQHTGGACTTDCVTVSWS